MFSIVLGQSNEIHGYIVDEKSKKPVSSVNIIIKQNDQGTVSDSNGYFTILSNETELELVFDHIGYKKKQVILKAATEQQIILLTPRVISLETLNVEEQEISRTLRDELFHSIKKIEKTTYQLRGYTDVGDLLKTEHGMLVDESFSGKKKISIRGGNKDETILLFNGIKLIDPYTGSFDISILPIDEIDRIEIIKGSHSTLFGPGAISGVVNLVTKQKPKHKLRIYQRLGTYDTGDWGARLHHHNDHVSGTYSFREFGSQRKTLSEDGKEHFIFHTGSNHLYYFAGESKRLGSSNAFRILSKTYFNNPYQSEKIESSHDLINGAWRKNGFDLSAGKQELYKKETTFFQQDLISREIKNTNITTNIKTRYQKENFSQTVSLQLETNSLLFGDSLYTREGSNIQDGVQQISDIRAGLTSILKMQNSILSDKEASTNAHLSFRYDQIKQQKTDSTKEEKEQTNDKFTWNFSSNFTDSLDSGTYSVFMNYGTAVRFPSTLQQFSKSRLDSSGITPSVKTPETVKGLELGITINSHAGNIPEITDVYSTINIFYNRYTDKIRTIYPAGYPTPLYDIIPDTKLSGIETSISILFSSKNAFQITAGLSKYFIPEKSLFPYKSEFKASGNVSTTIRGWNISTAAFYEGEQVGWIRRDGGYISEIVLPVNKNIDFNLGKQIRIFGIETQINLSVRNIFQEENQIFSGLSFRDRRVYLTGSISY